MNDNNRSNDMSPVVQTMIGFALGAVVGAGVALMLAPKSGEEMRAQLGETAKKLGGDAKDQMDQAREKMSGLGASTRSALEAGRDAFMAEATNPDNRPGISTDKRPTPVHSTT